MLAMVARSVVGMTVAPTIDFVRGKDVTPRDYLPFGHAVKSGYDMTDFAKDLGYTAVGATIAATPYTTIVGTEILTASSVSAATATVATATIGVGAMAAVMVYASGSEHANVILDPLYRPRSR
jgi:hypothetical protein